MAFEVPRGRQSLPSGSGHLSPNASTLKAAEKPWQTLTCKRQLPPNLCRIVCSVSLSWFLSAHKTRRPKIHPPYHQQGHEAHHSNCPLNALPVSAALAIRSFFPVGFSSLTVSMGEVCREKRCHTSFLGSIPASSRLTSWMASLPQFVPPYTLRLLSNELQLSFQGSRAIAQTQIYHGSPAFFPLQCLHAPATAQPLCCFWFKPDHPGEVIRLSSRDFALTGWERTHFQRFFKAT